uniref:Uncharacterized protein n=1 Tax=Tetradesmus obliquus TaxID=3088 RepID=A0A383VW53_TETOB|eukprot:jgi/Sobl393_1/12207/SZX69140.1
MLLAVKQQPRLTAIAEESSSCISSPTASSMQPTPRTLPAVGSSTIASAAPSGLTSPFSSTPWMSGHSAATTAATAAAADSCTGKPPDGSPQQTPVQRNSSSILRQLRHTSSGSSSRTAAMQQAPATPAATAAATDGFDPHPSYTTTPAMSGHNSSCQLAGLGSPSSPMDHELAAFLGEADPVDSWVSTHCEGALPPQQAWSRQQSRASTRRDSSGNAMAAASMQAALAIPMPGDMEEGEAAAAAAAAWDSPTSIPAASAAAAAAPARLSAAAYERSSSGSSSRRRSSASAAAAAAAAGTQRNSRQDHELSIGWQNCRRSSSAQHSEGLQQECTSSTFQWQQQVPPAWGPHGQGPETPAAFSGKQQQAAPWVADRPMRGRQVLQPANEQVHLQLQQGQIDAVDPYSEQQQMLLPQQGRQQQQQLQENFEQQRRRSSQQQQQQPLVDALQQAANSPVAASHALLSALNPLEFVLWQQRQHQRTLLDRALHALTSLQADVDNLLAASTNRTQPVQQVAAAALSEAAQATLAGDQQVLIADDAARQQQQGWSIKAGRSDEGGPATQQQQQQQQEQGSPSTTAAASGSSDLAAFEQELLQCEAAAPGRRLSAETMRQYYTAHGLSEDGKPAEEQQQQQQQQQQRVGDVRYTDDGVGSLGGLGQSEQNASQLPNAVHITQQQQQQQQQQQAEADVDDFEAQLLALEAAQPGRRLSADEEQQAAWQKASAGASSAELAADLQQQQQQQQQQGDGELDSFEAELLAAEAGEPGRRLSEEAAAAAAAAAADVAWAQAEPQQHAGVTLAAATRHGAGVAKGESTEQVSSSSTAPAAEAVAAQRPRLVKFQLPGDECAAASSGGGAATAAAAAANGPALASAAAQQQNEQQQELGGEGKQDDTAAAAAGGADEVDEFEAQLLKLEADAAAAAGIALPLRTAGSGSSSFCSSAQEAAAPAMNMPSKAVAVAAAAGCFAAATTDQGDALRERSNISVSSSVDDGSDDFEAMMRANETAARQAAGHGAAANTEDRWWEDSAPDKEQQDQQQQGTHSPAEQQQQQLQQEQQQGDAAALHGVVAQQAAAAALQQAVLPAKLLQHVMPAAEVAQQPNPAGAAAVEGLSLADSNISSISICSSHPEVVLQQQQQQQQQQQIQSSSGAAPSCSTTEQQAAAGQPFSTVETAATETATAAAAGVAGFPAVGSRRRSGAGSNSSRGSSGIAAPLAAPLPSSLQATSSATLQQQQQQQQQQQHAQQQRVSAKQHISSSCPGSSASAAHTTPLPPAAAAAAALGVSSANIQDPGNRTMGKQQCSSNSSCSSMTAPVQPCAVQLAGELAANLYDQVGVDLGRLHTSLSLEQSSFLSLPGESPSMYAAAGAGGVYAEPAYPTGVAATEAAVHAAVDQASSVMCGVSVAEAAAETAAAATEHSPCGSGAHQHAASRHRQPAAAGEAYVPGGGDAATCSSSQHSAAASSKCCCAGNCCRHCRESVHSQLAQNRKLMQNSSTSRCGVQQVGGADASAHRSAAAAPTPAGHRGMQLHAFSSMGAESSSSSIASTTSIIISSSSSAVSLDVQRSLCHQQPPHAPRAFNEPFVQQIHSKPPTSPRKPHSSSNSSSSKPSAHRLVKQLAGIDSKLQQLEALVQQDVQGELDLQAALQRQQQQRRRQHQQELRLRQELQESSSQWQQQQQWQQQRQWQPWECDDAAEADSVNLGCTDTHPLPRAERVDLAEHMLRPASAPCCSHPRAYVQRQQHPASRFAGASSCTGAHLDTYGSSHSAVYGFCNCSDAAGVGAAGASVEARPWSSGRLHGGYHSSSSRSSSSSSSSSFLGHYPAATHISPYHDVRAHQPVPTAHNGGSSSACMSGRAFEQQDRQQHQPGQLYGMPVELWVLPEQGSTGHAPGLHAGSTITGSSLRLDPPRTPDVAVRQYDRSRSSHYCSSAGMVRPASAPGVQRGTSVWMYSTRSSSSKGSHIADQRSVAGHSVGMSPGSQGSLWYEVVRECQAEVLEQAVLLSQTASVRAESRVMAAALRSSWDLLHG